MNNDKIIEQMKDYLYKNKRIEAIQYEIGMEDGWIILLLNMPEGEDYVNKVFTTKSDAENYITSPLFTREHNGKEYKIVPVMLYVLSDDEAEICPHVVLDNRRIEHEFVPIDENSLLVADESGFIEVMNNGTLSDFQEITSEEGGMQIKTKFSVNQKVFCVDKERRMTKKPCNICNGKGTITLKGKEYKCPECHGKGYGEYKNVYVIHEAVINRIKISVKEKAHISYRCIYDSDRKLPVKEKHKETSISEYEDNRMFGSYEEADTYCKQMNNGVEFFDGMAADKSDIIKVL